MFEHAVYSVISPEGCASILWRTADKAAEAAEAMRITAPDLQALGVIDRIVAEPLGGAHRDPDAAIGALEGARSSRSWTAAAAWAGRAARPAPRQVPRHRLRAAGTASVILRSKSPRDIRAAKWRSSACAKPAAGRGSAVALALRRARRRPRYLDPRDVAEAQRQHAELVQELGGAETGPRAAYVKSVGRRVAAFRASPTPARRFISRRSIRAVENALRRCRAAMSTSPAS